MAKIPLQPAQMEDDDVTLSVIAYHRFLTEKALIRHDGNRTHAAEDLGVSVRTLRNWLNKFKLGKKYPPSFR